MRAHSQNQPLTQRFSPQFTQQPMPEYGIMSLTRDRAEAIYTSAMSRLYGLVALGIAITGGGMWVGDKLGVSSVVYSFGWLGMLGMLAISIGMLIAAASVTAKGNPGLGTMIYLAFTGVEGLFLSPIMRAYDTNLIAVAFLMTAGLFVAMSLIGMTTKKDLTKWGPVLIFSLIGMIVISMVNIFLLKSSGLALLINVVVLLIFLGLTVYETKQVKEWIEEAARKGEENVATSVAVMGSINLYLNFLNIFLRMLALLSHFND